MDLSQCRPLMYLLSLEKPLTQTVSKVINSQQCDFRDSVAKVCCNFSSTNISNFLLNDQQEKKSAGISSTTTGEPITRRYRYRQTPSPEEKSYAMNKVMTNIYNDFFDFMAFDLTRRKRGHSDIDQLDIEIR